MSCCCEEAACTHVVLAAATKEAVRLTDKEREAILGVLGRDEEIRRDQQLRVMHLKAELQNLRRKGALRPSADWDSTGPDPDRSCGRCRVELGRVINRGAYCRACRLKVCKGCREYSFRTTDWVCTVCHKHMEIQAASGEWMNEFVRRPSRRRDNRVYVPAADIIKRTIRRSWTISNPTPRWTAPRGSPDLRPYNSLPRGQDIANYPSLVSRAPRSPPRRSHSEDVYDETPAPARVNPLVRFAASRRRSEAGKRVSFDACAHDDDAELSYAKEEATPLELCDIEPLSGTVFRKVTVRRRRKVPTVDTGSLVDILLPEGDDYRLVFISSSDGSGREEDDSSSTASSYPVDDCEWDYFEPGAPPPPLPPYSSSLQPTASCVHGCAAPHFIPIPVPVPIPFLVPLKMTCSMPPEKVSSSESVYNVNEGSDESSGEEEGEIKKKRFSKTFVVNKESSCSGNSESDEDTDTEMDCTVILTNVKRLSEDGIKEESSSVGLSDVSAESLNSSDLEKSSVGGDTARAVEGEQAGVPVVNVEPDTCMTRNAARYTSLVMITQQQEQQQPSYQQVSVITSDTTRLVPPDEDVVVVKHTNQDEEDEGGEMVTLIPPGGGDDVTVITGGETLSAFEEGLADDDSWVEDLSQDDDDDDDDSSSGEEVTLTCSAAIDQEDELRGYHRSAIDFTLHTIVEESCEESEVEQSFTVKEKPTTDLERYFFFRLGDGTSTATREDTFSETSSICSEGLDSLGNEEQQQQNDGDAAELASSRLEKYFLHGFMGFTAERRDSDGSVGSDSEGRPSPEQRRKKLVRARGTGRSHSSSLDNLLANPDLSSNDQSEVLNSENSDSDTCDESNNFEKCDGQFDTIKRKKGKKQKNTSSVDDLKTLETTQEVNEVENQSEEEEDGHKTPQPETPIPTNLTTNKNQQSRDSGFVGSCDDLIKEQRETSGSLEQKHELKLELENINEEKRYAPLSTPPATSLTRKDSFNNWSSDEETNLMMCKMRQFFKTMVANSSSKPTTPTLNRTSPRPLPSPRIKNRCKPPQLVYFENELTRLMKTVPGIRDDQVREIVEYLSSEDTWSDSYDSSDYTSSDLEGTTTKSALQQQISDSCKQIINKFDNVGGEDEEGDEGDGGIVDGLTNKETAFVYQKLVASFEKMAAGDSTNEITNSPHHSPPLIAKVMHHIGSRLVALMHEVSSGESHASNSPKRYHKRLQQKFSSASTTTTEDDDSTSDTNLPEPFEEAIPPYNLLPRSRSHDLLVAEKKIDISEEREASDGERFSWRGSFESALLAAADSRNRLSLVEQSTAAKRRSAGDLLVARDNEQLDRVRSEDGLWRRSSIPEAEESRATLPRSLQSVAAATNSLPRLPTTPVASIQKAQSMCHFVPPGAKSARYRPPGFGRLMTTAPKRAVSAPGLHHQRRGRRSQHLNVPSDDASISEAHSSPMLASSRGSKSATPSPVTAGSRRTTSGTGSQEWNSTTAPHDDIDRLVVLHQTRSSLSSLGLRSDSMASVYSGAGEGRYGSVAVRGQVEFGLQYNYKAKALEIHVKQCKDLAPVDVKRNRSDPYVKVYLLPDKSKSGKRKTKVKKHTLNPVFEETLRFHIALGELETRTLWLTVWHSDMFGRNDFLGEVMMALENKVFDDPTPICYNLQERTEPFDDMLSFKGDIIVCLKFVPPDMTVHKKGKRSRGTLHVLVKEAKSLTAVKANGTSDPFCKSYLLPDKGRSSKQKTAVAKRTVNPVWNHTFIYDDVTLQELAERCLELTVWDHDRLASNEFLGGVRFSLGTGRHYGKSVDWMDATGKELTLWKSMLERPNFWVEGCLSLRPTLDTRAS